MKTDFEKQVQDIFENHTESPSNSCWTKISQHLDTLPHQTPPASHGGNIFTQVIKSTIGKISIGAAFVGGVTATIYITEIKNNNNHSDRINTLTENTNCNPVKKENIQTLPIEETNSKTTNYTSKKQSFPTISNQTQQSENQPTNTISTVNSSSSTIKTNSTLSSSAEPSIEKQQAEVQKNKKVENTSTDDNYVFEETTEEFPNETEQLNEDEVVQPHFNIPNVFTPNGDNYNDLFVIEHVEGVSLGHLYIYNVNGKVLYENVNYNNDWAGDNLPDGLYLYIYKFIYKEREFIRKGMITIKRK